MNMKNFISWVVLIVSINLLWRGMNIESDSVVRSMLFPALLVILVVALLVKFFSLTGSKRSSFDSENNSEFFSGFGGGLEGGVAQSKDRLERGNDGSGNGSGGNTSYADETKYSSEGDYGGDI